MLNKLEVTYHLLTPKGVSFSIRRSYLGDIGWVAALHVHFMNNPIPLSIQEVITQIKSNKLISIEVKTVKGYKTDEV